jgi:hypothetical protein
MRIFEIEVDVNHYQYFVGETDDDDLKLRPDGTSLEEEWVPPKVRIYKPKLKRGDFFQSPSGSIIASPRATEVLKDFFVMAGELLPLPYKDEEFTFVNVTECIDCLDHEKSDLLMMELVFRPDLLSESQLFKIPESATVCIYVIEGREEPECEFRHAVESNGLKGLVFTEVWSDET